MAAVMGSREQFALALLAALRERSYEQITVSDLCRKAGLSRQTFYKFFADKDALLEAFAEGMNLKYLMHRDYRQKEGFFSFWLENRETAEVLINRGLIRRVARVHPQTLSMLGPLLEEGRTGQTNDSLRLLFEFVSAGEVRLLECWCAEGWQQTPEEMARTIEILLHGNGKMEQFMRQLQ